MNLGNLVQVYIEKYRAEARPIAASPCTTETGTDAESQPSLGTSIGNSGLDPNWEYEFKMDPEWEVPRENLVLGSILGEGAFGRVLKAQGRAITSPDFMGPVAVKMLKGSLSLNFSSCWCCSIGNTSG